MHWFVVFLAAFVGFVAAFVITFGVMLFIASRDRDPSAGGAYLAAAIMLSMLTCPTGAFALAWFVHKYQ